MAILTAVLLAVAAPALAAPATRAVRYLGYRIDIPDSWPIYDLRTQPRVCVRFDHHALYLGTPGSEQRCPAHAVGRTEAILLEPVSFGRRSVPGPLTDPGGAVTVARGRVLATATWGSNAGTVQRALGLQRLPAPAMFASRAPTTRRPTAHPAQSGGVYTGLGFDACAAPSPSAMSAWGISPYRAIGVYVGGTNMACAQPNLTTTWVNNETAAGWHLIPTYVGLQAPGACGCAAIIPSQASVEGAQAASNATAAAQAVGIGPGNPIYDDMEAYTRSSGNTRAVLAFLASWTSTLHAAGYRSGVYSSGGSGIADLVAKVGTSYLEPDDIWIADWNGQRTTSDPYVPASNFAAHQRLHQYAGGHNETYGKVTIDIDGDYLDGDTVGAGAPPTPVVNTAPPSISGVPSVGQTLSASPGAWNGSPVSYTYRWQRCTALCVNIAHARGQSYRAAAADIAAQLRVLVTASNGGARGQGVSGEVGPVAPSGYWLFTSFGNVYTSAGNGRFGSPAARGLRAPATRSMAATADGGGYWLAGPSGRVWDFGDAARLGWSHRSHPVVGIVPDPAGGYWLFTAYGNVYSSSGAGRFGSPAGRGLRAPAIVGMAATPDGGGYWLVGATGRVWSFGDAARLGWIRRSQPVRGIVADPTGGYWLFNSAGNVYPSPGARWFGSPRALGARLPTIVGMAATSDGGGYWLVGASGRVWSFADAPTSQ